jgi:hypothetical protein
MTLAKVWPSEAAADIAIPLIPAGADEPAASRCSWDLLRLAARDLVVSE